MENRKIRDFGKAKEDDIDAVVSNDGGGTTMKKSKIIESNAGPDTLSSGQPADDAVQDIKQQQQQQQQQVDGQDEGNDNSKVPAQDQQQPKQKGCDKCGKKFGLTGGFSCRCGGTFCAFHRYSDRHDCSFDYREMGASQIRRENPLIVPEKLRKL